jgi:site-specific recombinase XerD
MTRFASPFAQRMQAFLELKRALGRHYRAAEGELLRFDRYVAGLPDPPQAMTRELVHEWLAAKPHVRPGTQRSRAGVLRQFCLYLVRLDPRTYVPGRALFPATLPVFRAHIYSEEELRALLRAVPAVVSDRFALGRETIHTALLALYATGLRAGELGRLRVGDVDLAARTLFVRETKFFKSRLVPFSESLAEKLAAYFAARGAPTDPKAPFFVNRSRRPLSTQKISAIFHRLVLTAGIAARPGRRGPRLHDMRHTFAVHRVLAWYRAGADVTAKLPLLATYMGHASVLSTHVYLTATAELMREASRRFERAYGSLVVAQEEIANEVR